MEPWRKAAIVHHLKYTRSKPRRLVEWLWFGYDFRRSNLGYEIPGWDIVPISEHCHQQEAGSSCFQYSVHFTGNENTDPYWIKAGGGIENHQALAIALRLRLTFWALSGGWIFLFFPALVLLFVKIFV